MKKVKYLIISSLLIVSGCKKENVYPYPCLDGNCNTVFYIDTFVSPGAKLDVDGYWKIKYNGLQYFTIKGELAELNPQYVVNNVPLVETKYDSDYWIAFDSIKFKTPMYSYLSWFSNNSLDKPLPVGTKTYTITQLSKMTDLYNLSGYQITKNMCLNCPYTPTLLGTYSKYNYTPTKCIFFDKQMIGDTASIFIQVTYNCDNGRREIREKEMKIIFK